jgi:hypothetical protein
MNNNAKVKPCGADTTFAVQKTQTLDPQMNDYLLPYSYQ